ncbi:MAG: hypothetical protein KAI97_02215 [Gemmatimonadetes bacterium]|nr:hypothetical protein [Gemmatimonadota bacterium]
MVIPNNRDIGVKWRGEPGEGEGRAQLEFKGKVASLGVQTLAPGVTGVVERWVKWACDGETLQASSSVDVQKRRILRQVRLDSLGAVEVPRVGRESSVKRGLQIELTKLSFTGAPHWSLGFEAFPDDSDLHEEFSRNVSLFLQELPSSLRLSADTSFSYPEWLVRHANHTET